LATATWDVFRSDRLEIERALSIEAVRAALARGEIHDDDLIRPAGTTVAWVRLSDLPAIDDYLESREIERADARPVSEGAGAAAPAGPPRDAELGRLDLDLDRDPGTGENPRRVDLSSVELISWDAEAEAEEPDPLDEDEEAAAFTLSRGDPERVEELDLAAMVDVAFQLVLFFLVTATTVLYKSLEVPRPNSEPPAAGATQGKPQTLNDLKNDYILVEIDPGGAIKIDREPVAAELPALVERLRAARESTGRKAMLLSADAATPHRNAVLAYDAANEIGLGIAIARPSQKGDR
jgi:biopolymer transport protein ExbD